MSKPFWEDAYQDNAVSAFGEPSVEVKQIVNRLNKESSVLDIGCGEGRNSVYFAKSGFHVDAFDTSINGINKLNHTQILME